MSSDHPSGYVKTNSSLQINANPLMQEAEHPNEAMPPLTELFDKGTCYFDWIIYLFGLYLY